MSNYDNKKQSKLPRCNDQIKAAEVRVIDEKGEMLGIMTVRQAIIAAEGRGFDLVEISPNVEPPVCKFLDFGQYKYEVQKRTHESKKKQRVMHIKEIKLRPNIDTHDLEVKLKQITKFLTTGDKVKILLRFRGREITHQEIGEKVMQQIIESTVEVSKVESAPRMEGRQIVMVLAPASAK